MTARRIFLSSIIFGLFFAATNYRPPRAAGAVQDCRDPYIDPLAQACEQVTSVVQSHSQTVSGLRSEIEGMIRWAEDQVRSRIGWDAPLQITKLLFPAIAGDFGRFIGFTALEAETEHIVGDPARDGTSTWCVGNPAAHACPGCPSGTQPKWYVCLSCCASASPGNPKPAECASGNPGGFPSEFAPEASCCDCKPVEGSPLLRLSPPQDAARIIPKLREYRKNYSQATLEVQETFLGKDPGPITPIEFSLPSVYGLKRAFSDPLTKTGLWDWLFKNTAAGPAPAASRVAALAAAPACTLPAAGLPQTPACFAETLLPASDPIAITAHPDPTIDVTASYTCSPDPDNPGSYRCEGGASGTSAGNLKVEPKFGDALDYFAMATETISNFLPPKELESFNTHAGEGEFAFTFGEGSPTPVYEPEFIVPKAGIHEQSTELFERYGTPPNWLIP